MTELNVAQDPTCEHDWRNEKPAHASASVRACRLCHAIDGEDLMRTLNEYAQERMDLLRQKPTTLLYAWSDGQTFGVVDQPGGIPDIPRERALLRALLTHALGLLEEADFPLRTVALPAPDC